MQTIGTFRTWLGEEGYSARTREQYLTYATRARVDLGPLHRVTVEELRAWWGGLPPTASSRNAARNALVAYYRHRGNPKGLPAALLPHIPDRDHLPRPVPVEVYERFIDACADLGGKHQMLGFLLAYTGCRIGEARTCRRSNLDLTDLTWRIQGKGSGRRGPKERVVALHPRLGAVLSGWPEPDWVFPSPQRDGPIHRTTIAQLFKETADRAGLVLTAHQLRHTVATLGLDRTRDIRAVQELLGHASLATTQRYTQVTGSRVREVVGSLGAMAIHDAV